MQVDLSNEDLRVMLDALDNQRFYLGSDFDHLRELQRVDELHIRLSKLEERMIL